MNEDSEAIERTYWRSEHLGDRERVHDGRYKTKPKNANLISSLLENGKHAPVIDLDIPARLVPSFTKGHHHLYIDKAITWRQYRRILRALYKAGIIEKGYYWRSINRDATFVRCPGAIKEPERHQKNLRTLFVWCIVAIQICWKLLKSNLLEFAEHMRSKSYCLILWRGK